MKLYIVYSFLNFFDWSTGWCLVGFGSALLKIAIKHFQPIHHSYVKFFWGLTQSPFLYVLPHSPTKLPFNLKKKMKQMLHLVAELCRHMAPYDDSPIPTPNLSMKKAFCHRLTYVDKSKNQ